MWEIFSVHAVFTLSFASHPKPEWLWNQNTIFFPDISVVRIISFSDWRAFLSTLYTWHAYCICKNKSGTDEEQKINVSLTMYLPRHMIWLTHEKLCHEGISCYEPVMGHNVCMILQKLKYNVLSYRNGRHSPEIPWYIGEEDITRTRHRTILLLLESSSTQLSILQRH